MLIDAHAHLNFNSYKRDLDEIIKRTLDNDIWIINVGSQYTTSQKAVEIAQKYEKGVYAAIGLHPIHLNAGLVKIKLDKEEIAFNSREENFNYEEYKELAKNKKVVAIGEIGFDYYYKPKTKKKLELFKEKQKEVLSQQLKLAKEINLPVIFHCRMAHQDLIEFLRENRDIKPEKAVAHGFVGNSEELKKYLDLGYFIGFNGIIFKKIELTSRRILEVLL
jgi:TatD DNase family protein